MSGRLVPFIPDDYIEFDQLSSQCLEDLKNEIPSFIPPVGFVYTQYYECSAPWELFPDVTESSWQRLYITDGLFFCTEGGDSPSFNGTIKDDQFQGHRHSSNYGNTLTNTTLTYPRKDDTNNDFQGNGIGAVGNPVSDGTNGTPRIGLTTRPKSVTIRVWKRIS